MSMMDLKFLLGFLPAVLAVYWAVRRNVRVQNLVLMLASFFFYASFSLNYAALLLLCAGITYGGGLLGSIRNSRFIWKVTICVNFLFLIVFKYAGVLGISVFLPIGLSFYVFQSSTYLFDLLNNRQDVEKNIIDYMLFVFFFPTITSGPIQRSRKLLPQIRERKTLSYDGWKAACLRFLWGVFLKLVLADRLAYLTGEIFDHFMSYGGLEVWITMGLYSVQIYADFAGYSHMAIAAAELFGYHLEENFAQPYFATSIQEFWRRWHISLTTWFRDYVYIPLGGNRVSGLRHFLNILMVFVLSGIWHGAGNHFVVWGLLHGIYQISGLLTRSIRAGVRERIGWKTDSLWGGFFARVYVFFLVSVAWVFFRASSVSAAVGFLGRLLHSGTTGYLMEHLTEYRIAGIAIVLLIIVSALIRKGMKADVIVSKPTVVQWTIYLALMFGIVIFGYYGPGFQAADFIYEGF